MRTAEMQYKRNKDNSSNYVVPEFENIFLFFGIPSILKSDDDPPLNGHEFKDF